MYFFISYSDHYSAVLNPELRGAYSKGKSNITLGFISQECVAIVIAL